MTSPLLNVCQPGGVRQRASRRDAEKGRDEDEEAKERQKED
jgi:hypothetical protein